MFALSPSRLGVFFVSGGGLFMPKSAPAPRDPALDVVRALAILMVLTIHSASAGLWTPLAGGDWWSALAWGSAARPAVPLFFMCSGALMLGRELSPKRLLTHNLPRIAAAMFVWAFVHELSTMLADGGLSAAGLWEAFKRVVLFEHVSHFYYLHILLLVYAFLPIVRVFLRAASRREVEYLLAVWFVTGILFPLLQSFWPFTLVAPLRSWWKMNMAYAAIGYAVLGHYLRQYGGTVRRSWYHLAFWAGLSITFGGSALFSLRGGGLDERFWEGMSPGPMLMALGLFGLILGRERWPEPVIRITGQIAQGAFCIYLCHILFQRAFARVGISAGVSPCALTIPGMVVLLAAVGWLLWQVLHRVPAAGKYLV